MQETTFKKEDTGMDYDETFSYEITDIVPFCEECSFRYNNSQVAPCKDCTGLYDESNRSYFQPSRWVQ